MKSEPLPLTLSAILEDLASPVCPKASTAAESVEARDMNAYLEFVSQARPTRDLAAASSSMSAAFIRSNRQLLAASGADLDSLGQRVEDVKRAQAQLQRELQ